MGAGPARRYALLALATGFALLGLGPVAAHASRSQQTIFQDDGLLQRSGPVVQARALTAIKAVGATTVRVLVGWRNLAPDPSSVLPPAHFDAADPTAYPPGAFDSLDALVRGARARGLGVMLTPTGAIPDWASQCPPPLNVAQRNTCQPAPDQYRQFVEALGRRFSGVLDVRQWSLWNEPNLESWLRPQWTRVGGATIDAGAVLYRQLARAGIAGLRASGHGADRILLGETSPTGRLERGNSAAPLRFAARVLCLDDSGRPLRGADAVRYECTHPQRLPVTGYAHHPYTDGGFLPPDAKVRNAGEVTLGYIARLETLLARAERYRLPPRGVRIWNTEYGFQTKPPDPYGVSPSGQAFYLNQSEYISWLDPWLRSFAQYGLADDPDPASSNTGLIYDTRVRHGARKPAYDAFVTPIYVTRAGAGAVSVWGGARGARAGTRMRIEVGRRGGWAPVATVRSGPAGYVRQRVGVRARRWRLLWHDSAGRHHTSRTAAVDAAPVRQR